MDTPQLSGSPDTFRTMLRNAMRYWEPRPVTYNLILAAIAGRTQDTLQSKANYLLP